MYTKKAHGEKFEIPNMISEKGNFWFLTAIHLHTIIIQIEAHTHTGTQITCQNFQLENYPFFDSSSSFLLGNYITKSMAQYLPKIKIKKRERVGIALI